MRRKRILIALAIVLALPLAALAGALLYLRFADLGRHRAKVERIVTDALRRELRIEGKLEIEAGLTTRVVATDVRLASPDWATEPDMVRVERLEGTLEPLALLRGIVRLPTIAVEGARVNFEIDGDGRVNWAFDIPSDDSDDDAAPIVVELGTARLRRVAYVHRQPGLDGPLELDLASFEVEEDESSFLDLAVEGNIDGTPLTIAGRLGPFPELIRAGAVETELDVRIDDAAIALRAAVADLGRLEAPAASIEARGPDLARTLRLLRRSPIGEGPFEVRASLAPAARGSSVSLDVALDGLDVEARGSLGLQDEPVWADVAVDASGADLAAAGALLRVERLPADPFAIRGRLVWDGYPVRLEGIEVEVGPAHIAIDGSVGAPPGFPGTDLRVEARGPDLSALGAPAGVALPAEPFDARGRVVRVEGGLRFEQVAARAGAAVVEVDGTLGDPPSRAGTDLRLRAELPDPSVYAGLVGAPLPALPLAVAGRIAGRAEALAVESAAVRLGENSARVSGTIAPSGRFAGSRLRLEAEGPDLLWLEPWIGELARSIPAGAYRVTGGVALATDALLLDGVEARLGAIEVGADGRVGLAGRLAGSDLRLRAAGPDLSVLAAASGIAELPAEPFAVAGSAAVGVAATEIAGLEARVGDWTLEARGTVGHAADLRGSALTVAAAGPLVALAPFVGHALPDVPATVSGALEVTDDGYATDGLELAVGRHRLRLRGVVRPTEGHEGTELDVALSGPELRELGEWIGETGLAEVPALPAEPFSLSGHVTVEAERYRIPRLDLALGAAAATVSGQVGRSADRLGTDLDLRAEGPDATLLAALAGVELPPGPFRARGRVGREPGGIRLGRLELALAGHRADVDGVVGNPPELYGTNVDVRVEGPDLDLVARLLGKEDLPRLPFSVEGHFEGDPRRFKLERFSARLGSSDLSGSFRLDLAGKPRLAGSFASARIDTVELFPPPPPPPVPPPIAAADKAERPRHKIPRDPFDLQRLQDLDADVSWTIGELAAKLGSFVGLEVRGRLEDGALHVGPVVGPGRRGGILRGELWADPDPSGIAVQARFSVENARLDMFSVADDPASWPSVEVELELAGRGDSLHALASHAGGRVLVVLGEGAVDSSVFDLIAADFLRTLLDALNPFRKANPSRHLECAVLVSRIDDGIARFDPIAVQTDTLTIVGEGRIELEPETIDLSWAIKPRKGLGVSASTLTNPYIKVGGTLARPRLEMKPVEAVASTGAAVATAGLSILGRGLWDRVTAERKVCARALRRATREEAEAVRAQEAVPRGD